MASEIEKREKARRVWRLNKKEGIPVLEALESVDIGKDAYYRIKDEKESDWQEEILTAEQLGDELAELREEVEALEERAEAAEAELAEAEERAAGISQDAGWYDRVASNRDAINDLQMEFQTFAETIGFDVDAGRVEMRTISASAEESLERRFRDLKDQGAIVEFEEVRGEVREVEASVDRLDGRVSDVEAKVQKVRRTLGEQIDRVEEAIPTSIWELI